MRISNLLKNTYRNAANRARLNADWLQEQMSPYFFNAMADEPEALGTLVRELSSMLHNRRLILADRDRLLIQVCVDEPGSLYNSLKKLDDRDISFAMFSHSFSKMPDMNEELEVQRFEFDRKPNEIISGSKAVLIPAGLRRAIIRELEKITPDFDKQKALKLLKIIWLNSENQIKMAPPNRTAWLIWLFDRGNANGGLFLDIRKLEHRGISETRILFAVGNPPQGGFLLQLAELFNRLDIGIRRAYCLNITNGIHPYFLGTFFVRLRNGKEILDDSEICEQLQQELCNTQILDSDCNIYREWVMEGIMKGDDAALVNAFIAFCHTNLAHSQPERFGLDDVKNAFYAHPDMAMQMMRLFRTRFEPSLTERESDYSSLLKETTAEVEDYCTGHRWLDEIHQAIYRCCLLFINYTVKTNFFVIEKQALAFRIDPAYLRQLGSEFRADLPESLPFRITFFFSRFGYGYHIGFSDIARGGWRTVIARNQDDLITAANSLFREVYVLAHTQHLKNKDIYEGGSKLVLVMDATTGEQGSREHENNRLYKLQYGIANAFLDIFTTINGKAKNQRVVDYYSDDEPIELGPDENMHDSMVEAIAALSKKRGYLLGVGIISSKRFGINHKEYGVTSTGVMTFAEVVMAERGINIHSDPFSIKITGGPGGDVAGNCLKIILESCPNARIVLVLDGTAATYDPAGLNREELRRITLQADLDSFDPKLINPGGLMIFRTGSKMDGLRQLYRRFERDLSGHFKESWYSLDDFYHEYGSLIFKVEADLFIPAGGRPETIDINNWKDFLKSDGTPSSQIIIEGANSFITPEARIQLQRSGVINIRDASANKCGVISSSYEIIANLLLTEKEFFAKKERYVADVLKILKKRASDEARLIVKRWNEAAGMQLYTEISEQISQNINSYYHRLFEFFNERTELCLKEPFRSALLRHLPEMLQELPSCRNRISKLPPKYLPAMLAAEIACSLVYSSNRDDDFEDMIRRHLMRIEA